MASRFFSLPVSFMVSPFFCYPSHPFLILNRQGNTWPIEKDRMFPEFLCRLRKSRFCFCICPSCCSLWLSLTVYHKMPCFSIIILYPLLNGMYFYLLQNFQSFKQNSLPSENSASSGCPNILTVSSKRQISLPVSIRKLLSIDNGNKLAAYARRKVLLTFLRNFIQTSADYSRYAIETHWGTDLVCHLLPIPIAFRQNSTSIPS